MIYAGLIVKFSLGAFLQNASNKVIAELMTANINIIDVGVNSSLNKIATQGAMHLAIKL